jgi:hypothetical protein
MAARLSPKHDDKTREKIKTSQLVNRLNAFVLGEADPTTKEPVDMSSVQVTAALGLLKKTLPDLTAGQMVHDVSDPLKELLQSIDGKSRGISEGS